MGEPGPPAKRQRKPPAWAEEFLDPTKPLSTLLPEAAAAQAPADVGQGQAYDGADGFEEGLPEEPQVVAVTALENSGRVEVLVEHQGRRYKGTMERTALPHGVGVPLPATREELLASAAAPVHGENPNMTCALCNLPLDEVPVQGISEDKAGLFARVRITTNWTARVHQQCAVWCPECKEDTALPNYYHYLGPAVRRGRALRCSRCTERGATVGCFAEGCPAVYHLPCAVDNGCLFNERTYEVWCPEHAQAALEQAEDTAPLLHAGFRPQR